MKLNASSSITIAFLTTSVYAQQAPGEFRSEPAISPPPAEFIRERKPVAQAPGKFDISSSDTEILRLKALVESQQKKISLLDAKIKLLEAELKKQKE
jgi:hypothetical protein